MHGKRFKDFILRMVIASAHGYFVPAWGEGMPASKQAPIAPFVKPDTSQPTAASSFRDARARTDRAGHWRDLLLQGDRTRRVGRSAGTPDLASTSILDRYM